MKKIFVIAVLSLLAFVGCNRNEIETPTPAQQISTLQAKNIFHDRAVLQGKYTGDASQVKKYGFEFADTDPESASTTLLSEDLAEGKFTCSVDGLEKNTDYVATAFVTLNNGETVRGNKILFTTSKYVIEQPGVPSSNATVLNGKQVIISELPSTLGDSNLSATDQVAVTVKIAELGIYYWPEAEGRSAAKKFVIEEAFANEKDTKSATEYTINGLTPATKYCYVPYIKTGAYYYTNVWVSYSDEVEGAEGSFETLALEEPVVVTNEGMSITATSFIGAAVLNSDGNDPDVKFGIEVGKSEGSFETKVYAKGLENESLKSYVAFVKDLAPLTTYYFRAFAENDAYSVGSSVVNSFVTDEAGQPVLDDYIIPYTERAASFTQSKVKLRAKLLSNGGQAVTSQGFYYGSSVDAITNKVEAGKDVATDGTYDYFEVEIADLPQGIVYYKPFAANASGEAVFEEVCQVSTVINGGYQYVFDKTIGSLPMFNNMVYSTNTLEYIELDPIVSGEVVYYMLDRNIGASKPYDETFYNKVFDTEISCPDLFEAAGYYYQFNRSKPSATPDVKIVTNMGAEPYNWTKTASYFTNPGMNTAEWAVNNCPEGYEMPTSEDFRNIVTAIAPKNPDQTLANLFEATRFGITGARAPANGNMTANTASAVTVEFWTKDANADNTNALSAKIGAGPAGTFSTTTANVYTGRPIRCIRKVTKTE